MHVCRTLNKFYSLFYLYLSCCHDATPVFSSSLSLLLHCCVMSRPTPVTLVCYTCFIRAHIMPMPSMPSITLIGYYVSAFIEFIYATGTSSPIRLRTADKHARVPNSERHRQAPSGFINSILRDFTCKNAGSGLSQARLALKHGARIRARPSRRAL